MDCKICGKDIKEHDLENVIECFDSIGIKVDKNNVSALMEKAGISVTTNPRHKYVAYNGFSVTYEDLELEIMRFCLAGPKIKKMVPDWKKNAIKLSAKEKKEEDETWQN
jgi:hypothetical protein